MWFCFFCDWLTFAFLCLFDNFTVVRFNDRLPLSPVPVLSCSTYMVRFWPRGFDIDEINWYICRVIRKGEFLVD